MAKTERRYRLIDGNILPEESRLIGYCWHNLHRGFLTQGLLKAHECLEKQCPFLERFPDKHFWVRKKEIKDNRNKAKNNKALERLILERFRELTADFDGFAVCVVEFKDDIFWVRCVKTQTVFIKEIKDQISKEFNVPLKVFYVQNEFEVRAELIRIIKEREENEKYY